MRHHRVAQDAKKQLDSEATRDDTALSALYHRVWIQNPQLHGLARMDDRGERGSAHGFQSPPPAEVLPPFPSLALGTFVVGLVVPQGHGFARSDQHWRGYRVQGKALADGKIQS